MDMLILLYRKKYGTELNASKLILKFFLFIGIFYNTFFSYILAIEISGSHITRVIHLNIQRHIIMF